MAKKTNKTDHVLNLLSGGGAKNETENNKETGPAPPVIPEGTVSVVESVDEDGQIADTIRKSLEQELEKMERVPASQVTALKSAREIDSPSDVEKTDTEETPQKVVNTVIEAKAAVESRSSEAAEAAAESKASEAAKTAAESRSSEAAEAAAESKASEAARVPHKEELETGNNTMTQGRPETGSNIVIQERAEAVNRIVPEAVKVLEKEGVPKTIDMTAGETQQEPISEAEAPETRFILVNVMERLVQEKAHYYMEQFGVCTCPRCTADVTALALTKLPPKYVVVNKEAVSPLINFYSNKYAGQITVEITKACIRVGENPYHSED